MSMFADFMKTGLAQCLEVAGSTIVWVFEGGQERPVTALVSEENVVERIVGGQRTLVRSRGVTLSEDEAQPLFAVKRPNQRDRFDVPEGAGFVRYAVHETVSRADGGTTIVGDRIERRETVKAGYFGNGR